MTRVRLIRASFFLWLIVPTAAYLAYQAYGLPHVIWSYSWLDNGRGYDPYASRHYTSCTYVGPYGVFTDAAPGGRCGWVQFHKARGS
jgi:hypothetical protein